jgi:DNA-binding NarL/FixJ family response regulator
VLVVDDHPVVRQGLRTFLDLQDDITVVGEAADGEAALAEALEHSPDVVLLDLRMPGADGASALRAFREHEVPAKVLVVTSFTDPSAVLPPLRAGGGGFVYKDLDPLARAPPIRGVHTGHLLLYADVARLLASGAAAAAGPDLTPRERAVLAEIARGRSNREIARALNVAEKTVKTHVSAIFTKLGVADRTQAALHAVRSGLV